MIRGIGLRGAVSLNLITMIGIGPLITIPLVLAQLAGPLALAGWIAGGIVALCDGLVWAELGSRYPGAGGTYVYLREIFGARGWGRLLAFLFNWQYFLSASLVISTGYIGFANYAGFLFPHVGSVPMLNHVVALGVGIVTIALLYRRVNTAASFGVLLAVAAVGTLIVVAVAGYARADFHRAFTLNSPSSFGMGFLAGLGSALYITLYDYAGYSASALVGEELRAPQRTLPRSIVLSVLIVLLLYLLLQIGVLAGIPWQTLVGRDGAPAPPQAQYVASTVVANAWGTVAAKAVTILILVTAFASVYGGLLAAARVPFAAARDGSFLPAFAALHPRKAFPHVSLLAMGGISLIACFFDLGFVIAVLSACGILMQGIAQIAALMVFRARGERAPFRMVLFPLPALVALAGWILAFVNTGTPAILLGTGWLLAGAGVYLLTAHARGLWPFAAAAAGALLLCAFPLNARAAASRDFLYGASFFYERIPRAQWSDALDRYRAMGINTIDLYVMWNWHEPVREQFDFTGRTNPRRDLLGLFGLIHSKGFRVILRPGPVIRNEWRNGGYPAWLLVRAPYDMPRRDVLEGRYPATATLQNAHSDAAAAQWMRNPLHMQFAMRWLQRCFAAVAPWRSSIIAVALDDDQGAYLDNDTWPGPNFHRYIRYLAAIAHRGLGANMPVFINTYQMKVTASTPVWAWGNWYQSDAYSIGEHDRSQLELTAGLLQTQESRAVMFSEFQAGWLQNADEPAPRAADPTNTTLALHTLLQMGAHGIVNFPVQDTLNPAGWEAPWANALYAWDAALSVSLKPQARYAPTQRFGALVRRYGKMLTQTQVASDAAIAYLTSAYDAARISNDDVARIADQTISAQRGCRIVRITCRLVDLRFDSLQDLGRTKVLIVPAALRGLPFIPEVERKIAAFRAHAGRVVSSARYARVSNPAAGRIPNAALLVSYDGRYAFLDIVNYGRSVLRTRAARVHQGSFSAYVPALSVAGRDAVLLPLGVVALRQAQHDTDSPQRDEIVPLRPGASITASLPAQSGVYRADVFQDGYPAVLFQNMLVRLVLSPCAGARAFVFEDRVNADNVFTTIGGLRDSWNEPLAPSARDYIAAYTHPIATGTFNRCYASEIDKRSLSASFTYAAPDAPPEGASFRKTVTLERTAASFSVQLHAAFPHAPRQRAQELTSVAIDSATRIVRITNGIQFVEPRRARILVVTWAREDVETAQVERHVSDALLTLTFRPGGGQTRFALLRRRVSERSRIGRGRTRGSGGTADAAASKAAGHNP